ncbi:MAG: hypothetical protein L6Q99_17860 [Planctomycetes bacterium]|nr:hypothetical protein [Planctomycetota bacterium]
MSAPARAFDRCALRTHATRLVRAGARASSWLVGAASCLVIAGTTAAARTSAPPTEPAWRSVQDTNAARVDERAFARVELRAPARPYYVGETVPLEVELTLDVALTRPSWPQLSPQPLDVPVRLVASWLDAVPFGRMLAIDDSPRETSRTFALAHGPATARIVESTAERVKLLHSRSALAERAGSFELEAPRLEFAAIARTAQDVFDSSVAVDTLAVDVVGEPRRFEIRDLPDAGRPVAFGGAIGAFTLTVDAEPRELAVGDELALVVTVASTLGSRGSDADFAPPRLANGDAWQTLGVVADVAPDSRTFRFSLRARSAAVRKAPSVEFAYFDPAAATYRTLANDGLDVVVRASAAARDPEDPAAGANGDEPPRRRLWPWAGGVTTALVLLAVGARRRRRTRRAERPERARGALPAFERALALVAPNANEDLERAWTEFLAAELGVGTAAVSTHDIRSRLVHAGASQATAERAARSLAKFVGARFGGAAAEVERAEFHEIVELARALDAELAERSARENAAR